MKFRERLTILFLIGVLVLFPGGTSAEILFQDDFETGEIDRSKWTPTPGWTVVDNTDAHPVLGEKVLDIWGGDEGLSVDEFPEEFDYYADFKVVGLFDIPGFGRVSVAGFIFHAQDLDNHYMHQPAVAGDEVTTPQHIRWHRKIGGVWKVEPLPFADGRNREPDVWYRVKFEVRKDHHFKVYLGDVGATPDKLVLVSEWTDSNQSFKSGKIGFRGFGKVGAGEHFQIDNVRIETPDQTTTTVDPKGNSQ